MAGRITEEQVTKSIIHWLKDLNWEIICYDFPQSGTGKVLHQNLNKGEKNKNTTIPDIVAIKKNIVVYFENKDRLYPLDFEKLSHIKQDQLYSDALANLLKDHKYTKIFYGIGLPITQDNIKKLDNYKLFVDFVVNSDGKLISAYYDDYSIFI